MTSVAVTLAPEGRPPTVAVARRAECLNAFMLSREALSTKCFLGGGVGPVVVVVAGSAVNVAVTA